jgi:hypothetical protein
MSPSYIPSTHSIPAGTKRWTNAMYSSPEIVGGTGPRKVEKNKRCKNQDNQNKILHPRPHPPVFRFLIHSTQPPRPSHPRKKDKTRKMVKNKVDITTQREPGSIVSHLYPCIHKSNLVEARKKLPNTPVSPHHPSQGHDVIKNSQKTHPCPRATQSPPPPP